MKLFKYLLISLTLLFSGCFHDLDTPTQQQRVTFPTFNTSGLKTKTDLNITVYPLPAENNTTIFVLKEKDYKTWKEKTLLDTKDFNTLLDQINKFNIELKAKESEYNK